LAVADELGKIIDTLNNVDHLYHIDNKTSINLSKQNNYVCLLNGMDGELANSWEVPKDIYCQYAKQGSTQWHPL
jgi:hypothetical protein